MAWRYRCVDAYRPDRSDTARCFQWVVYCRVTSSTFHVRLVPPKGYIQLYLAKLTLRSRMLMHLDALALQDRRSHPVPCCGSSSGTFTPSMADAPPAFDFVFTRIFHLVDIMTITGSCLEHVIYLIYGDTVLRFRAPAGLDCRGTHLPLARSSTRSCMYMGTCSMPHHSSHHALRLVGVS